MEIPAFFASYMHGKMVASDGCFTAVAPKAGEEFYDFSETVQKGIDREHRAPVVVIDCNSFEEREFSEKVMKHLKVPGADVWLMTYIETVEDVFDAFNKDAELVLAPYHFIKDDAELRDICDVSDSVVPVISVHKGKAVTGNGRPADVVSVLEKLVSIGYYKNYVMDAKGSLDGYTWSIIADDYPSTIPMVNSSIEGFQNFIRPYPI